jgi:translation initiation factor 3 subunit E
MASETAQSTASKKVDASEYDLTQKISPFLDAHLVFPLLDFLEENTSYEAGSVQRARLDLLAPTNMVDYAIEIRSALGDANAALVEGAPSVEAMEARRDAVFEAMEALEAKVQRVAEVLEDAEAVEQMKRDGTYTAADLEAKHGIGPANWADYFEFAKFLYECGDYEGARDMLDHYLALCFPAGKKLDASGFRALWGKFGSEVLLKNWEGALHDLGRLRTAIDDFGAPPLEQLQQRSWLLHWSLFVFFNHAKGHDGIIDLFLNEKYLQAIQTNCPWLLRYLTTAVIINKRRRSTLKDLVRVITMEHELKGDPVTQFLECLYVKFDFEGAQRTLAECDKALRSDYFLCNCADAFMEDARLFVFETYCRIHTKIDIGMLSDKLVMEREKAERWVVDLIRGALLDAKIDSQDSCVVMGTDTTSVYSQVIDKTRDLSNRSAALLSALETKICEAN